MTISRTGRIVFNQKRMRQATARREEELIRLAMRNAVGPNSNRCEQGELKT